MTAAPAAMAVPAETAAWAAPGVLAGRLDYWGMSAGPETAGLAGVGGWVERLVTAVPAATVAVGWPPVTVGPAVMAVTEPRVPAMPI